MPLTDSVKNMISTGKVNPKPYSKMEDEPKPSPGEFPGDFEEKYKSWEQNLSPEDKQKRRLKKAKEANINL